jgi:hypothetical protein
MNTLYLLRRAYSYIKEHRNWIDAILGLKRKEMIVVFLRAAYRNNQGMCTLECARTIVTLITNLGLDINKFHFENGNLYYDRNLIVQENEASVLLSAYGFIKIGNEWFFQNIT